MNHVLGAFLFVLGQPSRQRPRCCPAAATGVAKAGGWQRWGLHSVFLWGARTTGEQRLPVLGCLWLRWDGAVVSCKSHPKIMGARGGGISGVEAAYGAPLPKLGWMKALLRPPLSQQIPHTPPALEGCCGDGAGGPSVPSSTWDPLSPPWGRFSVPCPILGQLSAAFIAPSAESRVPPWGVPVPAGDVLNPAPGGVSCPLPGESVGTLL